MNTEYIEYTIKMLELCVNEYKRKDSDTKSIKRLMDRIIREFDNHKRPLKSQAAQALFPNFDLSNLSWSNQCKIDPKREKLVYEHKDTVKMKIEKILQAKPREEIKNVLLSAEIVWITREEDARLTKLGFKSNRPDSNLAYTQSNIIVIKNLL